MRGFRFRVFKVTRSCLRPSAEDNKAARRTQENTSGTQGIYCLTHGGKISEKVEF